MFANYNKLKNYVGKSQGKILNSRHKAPGKQPIWNSTGGGFENVPYKAISCSRVGSE